MSDWMHGICLRIRYASASQMSFVSRPQICFSLFDSYARQPDRVSSSLKKPFASFSLCMLGVIMSRRPVFSH